MEWQPASVEPTDEDAEYILCISGHMRNKTYERAVVTDECYWEKRRGWFIHGFKKPDSITVHAWLLPEPYQD